MGVRKNIYFSEEEYESLQKIKNDYGLKTDSAAISFLLQSGSVTKKHCKSRSK